MLEDPKSVKKSYDLTVFALFWIWQGKAAVRTMMK